MTAATITPVLSPAVTARLRQSGHAVLAVVAVCGAVLSYESLRAAAAPVFGGLAYGFPLLVDALILGASLQYVAGARTKAPGRFGWRLTAHAGIAGTITLNALASTTVAGVPWHVTAPAVWAVLVELYARQFAGEWRAQHARPDTIPLRLWIRHPWDSARAWLMQARRTADPAAHAAAGVQAAAREAIRLTLPGVRHRGRRRLLTGLLRSGALTPGTVLDACGWTTDTQRAPAEAFRLALADILAASTTLAPTKTRHAKPPARIPSGRDTEAVAAAPEGPGDGHTAPPPARLSVVHDDDMLSIAREVAAEIVGSGQRLSRDTLGPALRARLGSCSQPTVNRLWKEINPRREVTA